MRPTRFATALCFALASGACVDTVTPPPSAYLRLDPVLDSLYVGDLMVPPKVTYYDPSGVASTPPASTVRWASSDTSVFVVDSLSGHVQARRHGIALLVALVQQAQGEALVVVSNTLDMTLLMDTIYAMPGDTLDVPVAVRKQNSPPAAVVWYQAPTNAVYSIDSLTGRLTALAQGGPIPYYVHADTIADTGAVYVLSLADTTGGQFFFSVVGTVVTHVGGPIGAVNYRRSDGKLAFRLRGTHSTSGLLAQIVQITLLDSVLAAGSFPIDSLSPAEGALMGVSRPVAICTPPRPWAVWSSPTILAYSRPAGTLAISQIVMVPNGQAISGHFLYQAQRTDLYTDPLGLLTIQGSFVAPLVTDQSVCQ
jgi:hypothetical protein